MCDISNLCDSGKLGEKLKSGYKIINLKIGEDKMSKHKIEFNFNNLLDTEKKVREYRDKYNNCTVVVKISKEDHDRLINYKLLGDMSLDDVLNCEMRVV